MGMEKMPPLPPSTSESKEENDESESSTNITRRGFLRGAAAGALGTVLSSGAESAAQDHTRRPERADLVTMNVAIGIPFENALKRFEDLEHEAPLPKGYRRYLEEHLREVKSQQQKALDVKQAQELAQRENIIGNLFEDSTSFSRHMLSYTKLPIKERTWSKLSREGFTQGLQIWAIKRETSPERLLKHYDDRATELLAKGAFDNKQAAQFVLREIAIQKDLQRVRGQAADIINRLRTYDISTDEESIGLAIYTTLNEREKFWNGLRN